MLGLPGMYQEGTAPTEISTNPVIWEPGKEEGPHGWLRTPSAASIQLHMARLRTGPAHHHSFPITLSAIWFHEVGESTETLIKNTLEFLLEKVVGNVGAAWNELLNSWTQLTLQQQLCRTCMPRGLCWEAGSRNWKFPSQKYGPEAQKQNINVQPLNLRAQENPETHWGLARISCRKIHAKLAKCKAGVSRVGFKAFCQKRKKWRAKIRSNRTNRSMGGRKKVYQTNEKREIAGISGY